MAERTVEILNLVVKLGSKELLDLFEGWIWPILQVGTLAGRGETIRYEFLGATLDTINGHPVVYGRVIKIVKIEAEQEFDDKRKQLIESAASMACAPSAFFLVDLGNHKVAYFSETKRAPSARDFEYLLKRLVKKEWDRRYHDLERAWLKENGVKRFPRNAREKVMKQLIIALGGFPDVRLTPLPAVKEVDAKLGAFQLVKKVRIGVLDTNDERADEYEEFLRSCQNSKTSLNANRLSVEIANQKTGLKKEEIKELVESSSDGNYLVTLEGVNKSGAKMATTLDEVSFKAKATTVRESSENRARRLLNLMGQAMKAGLILSKDPARSVIERAQTLVEALLKRQKNE